MIFADTKIYAKFRFSDTSKSFEWFIEEDKALSDGLLYILAALWGGGGSV